MKVDVRTHSFSTVHCCVSWFVIDSLPLVDAFQEHQEGEQVQARSGLAIYHKLK